MKKCGLKTDPVTNRCIYQSGDECLFLGSCHHLQSPPNCGSSVQRPPAPPTSGSNAVNPKYTPPTSVKPKLSLEERAKQDCSSCDHKTVCKHKEKFETLKKEHFPLLCICQWYKEENDICTE